MFRKLGRTPQEGPEFPGRNNVLNSSIKWLLEEEELCSSLLSFLFLFFFLFHFLSIFDSLVEREKWRKRESLRERERERERDGGGGGGRESGFFFIATPHQAFARADKACRSAWLQSVLQSYTHVRSFVAAKLAFWSGAFADVSIDWPKLQVFYKLQLFQPFWTRRFNSELLVPFFFFQSAISAGRLKEFFFP